MEYGFESEDVWNMAVGVVCVEYGLRGVVCGILF